MPTTILVTGYGGFLGSAICRDLLANGYRVRGIARNVYQPLADQGVECVRGSIVDRNTCLSATQGVDAIIHTAAIAGVWGPRREYEATNVVATTNLLDAARANHVPAFVFSSSPSVTFDGSPQRNVNESAPYPTRWLCDYSRTKAIAEQNVLAANDASSLRTCALRPHLIWGVGDAHLIPRVIDRCRRGRLRCVGDGRNLIDTVHVDHAAIAHRHALERLLNCDDRASGRAYFITDAQPVACWDWISDIVRAAGMEPPTGRISFATAYRIGATLELTYRILRIRKEPPMTRFVAAQLGVDHYFDVSSARERLAYVPIPNRDERLTELRQWISASFEI